MGDTLRGDPRIPLLPLSDVVHFPHTEIELHVTEPAVRRMVEDVIANEHGPHWIGIVLPKPGWDRQRQAHPEIYPAGTAGRILDSDFHADGHTEIVLHGEFRFELRRELNQEPYREGVVHPVEEPWLNERDAGIVAVRRNLLELLRALAAELGERFPIGSKAIDALAEQCFFEELVNHVASELDVPASRKLQLLYETLPERGTSLLAILRGRLETVDLLRPFRHLLGAAALN